MMKKLLLSILLFIPITLRAAGSIFSFSLEVIEVPYKADLSIYFQRALESISLKEGYNDPDFYVIDDMVEYTSKSTINTNHLGSKKHKYKAVSPKYNQEEIHTITFIIVDKIPPYVVSSEPIVMHIGEVKPNFLAFIHAKDNHTKEEDLLIDVVDYHVDYNHIGSYEIIYTIKDASHNKTLHPQQLTIIDTIKPTIHFSNLNTHQKGSIFHIEDYVSATDNYDPNPLITYVVEGSLDEVGSIILIITATDSSNNATTQEKTIYVQNNRPPILVLSKTHLNVEVHSDTINYYSYIAMISEGFDFKDIVIEDNVRYDVVGVYEVLFILNDNDNNQTTQSLVITIQDKTPPIASSEPLIIHLNEDVDLKSGVMIQDNYSTKEKLVLNVFETNFKQKPGTYYILYEIIDESGNHTYHQRMITVKGTTPLQKIYITSSIAIGVLLCLGVGFVIYKKKRP